MSVPAAGSTEPAVIFGARFVSALEYAVNLHAHDVRKGTGIPYVGHLLGVCALVIDARGDEDEAIAALLHDAAEDHGGSSCLDVIRARFGDRVARIVERCSDSLSADPNHKAPWLERKRRYVAQLRAHAAEGDTSTLLVSAADKVSNLRSIANDLADARVGEAVFRRFKGGKWGTLWYYRALSDTFSAYAGKHEGLARELETLIVRLANGAAASELFARYESQAPSTAAR